MFRSETLRTSAVAGDIARSRLLTPVFLLLLFAAAAPIFADTIPPLADYVNHLGRMHVLASIGSDPILARLYEIDWAIIPNLVMDLVVPLLNRWMNIYLSGQVFIFVIIVLLATGPMAVHRALFGVLSPWPLLAFPFMYNAVFLLGLMNYLFGLGVALWGMAAWIHLRNRRPLLRAGVSLAFVLITFTCHLFALGLYGMALLAMELWGVVVKRRLSVTDLLVFGAPFLPVLPLMLMSPTLGLSTENIWESSGKIGGIFYIIQTYSDSFDLTLGGLVVAYIMWAARRGALTLHPAGLSLLLVGTAVFMAMPRMLFGSWEADQRLPVAIFFMVLGFVRFKAPDRSARYAFYAFVIGISLVRYVDVSAHWRGIQRVNHDISESVHLIEPGSSVLVAHADQPHGSDAANQALSHAPCIAMIERAALVSTAFSVQGKQILNIRPAFRNRVDADDGDPPTVSQLLATVDGSVPGQPQFWDAWPARYDYVYVLYTDSDPNPDPEHLTLVHEGRQFQLYRVVNQTAADEED